MKTRINEEIELKFVPVPEEELSTPPDESVLDLPAEQRLPALLQGTGMKKVFVFPPETSIEQMRQKI